jgi:tetraacyldisaccharide 4'-kinase
VAGRVSAALLEAGARAYGAAWEARRNAYAQGLLRPKRAACRVVSVGNLTTGGTGKTTLTLHLAQLALARGIETVVIGRRYRPGPEGRGDEELLYRQILGATRVLAGRSKRDLAVAAASRVSLALIDDGFSHWGLARDVDLVLLDAREPWGGGRLLPAGRLREPLRALQRAQAVILSRLAPGADPQALFDEVRSYAPAAQLAAGRHRVRGVRGLDGAARAAGGRAHVVTATGNPGAVSATATEAGYEVVALSAYRDHHWFTPSEARVERTRAATSGATLLLTAKDAVRWPERDPDVAVLEIEWAWVANGERIERLVLGEDA